MKVGKRTNLYAVAGVVTTRTGNKVAAAKTSGMGARATRFLLTVVDTLIDEATVRAACDVGDGDRSQCWSYGGDAA